MYEVEAKIWVKEEAEWQDLLTRVKKLAVFEKEVLKEDFYFGKFLERKTLFRLRILDGKVNEIVIKNKNIEAGVEENEETFFQIDNQEAFLDFAKKLGYAVISKKTKHSLVFRQNEIFIELNKVEGLGNFLEIECICKKQAEMPSAKMKIINLFEKLGFTSQDFESRSYRELIENMALFS